MQNDHTLERALAQFEALMHLRPTFLHYNSVLVSIDHAIGNVFEDQNYDKISKYIIKIRELVDFVAKMNWHGVGTTGIELPLPDLHISVQCHTLGLRETGLRNRTTIPQDIYEIKNENMSKAAIPVVTSPISSIPVKDKAKAASEEAHIPYI